MKHPETIQKIGMLLQEDTYLNLNAIANLKMIACLNLAPFKKDYHKMLDHYNLPYKRKVKDFSFGMKQRLRLAMVLDYPYDLYILDEPYVGLDPLGVMALKDEILSLKEQGATILISSHQLSEVDDLCDRFLYLANGTLTETEQLISKQIIIKYRHFKNIAQVQALLNIQVDENEHKLVFNHDLAVLKKVLLLFDEHELATLDIKINQYVDIQE